MACKSALVGMATLAILTAWTAAADEPKEAKEPAKDFGEFSKLLHKMVVARTPRFVEDNSGWGQSIAITEKLPLAGLRIRVKVGERDEYPHGLWRKFRASMDEPAKSIQIDVRDFKQVDGKMFKLSLEAQAAIQGDIEIMHWQKGLKLINAVAQGSATVATNIDCDVAVSVKGFPPELVVEPKVTSCKLTLREFNLKDVTLRRLGTVLEGEQARSVGNDLKEFLQSGLTAIEPEVKSRVNEAIAQSIREGKGTISAGSILQLISPEKK